MSPRTALTFALAILIPAGVLAQTSQPRQEPDVSAPAHVSHVEGTVTLERDGRPETSPLNMPLLSGDRLKTVDGRVEILFADGSALHLDTRSTLDIQSDELARLIDGRMRLAMAGRGLTYRIDSPAGSVRIAQPGEFKLSMLHGDNETQLELAVIRGAAEIFTDQGSTTVRAGERAYASAGLAPSYAYNYNSANFDAFDQWAEARRDTRLGVSAQYLPEDVRPYSTTFDQYGDWRYEQTYGYVWYPRVAATWRPYYYGRWASYPRYGWTWVGVDSFAWPTHHYGRWGFSAGAWFWIPSSHWAPAYVSWAYAPGYVSWCPLGFDNRPVFGFSFNVGPAYYSSYAWTAVSYTHFGHNYYVHQRAVHWDHAHPAPNFVVRPAAPAYRSAGYAASTAAPIRSPGARDVAVPRGSTLAYGNRDIAVPRGNAATGRDVAVPRGSTAPYASRDAATPMTRPIAPQSAGASREIAVIRGSAAPRYVNRGDDIVRSQTARPVPPSSPTATDARTVPDVTGRRADPGPSAYGRVAPPRYDREPNAYATPSVATPTAVERVHPNYQPRTAAPRTEIPVDRLGTEGATMNPAYRPRYEPPTRPVEYARPRPESPAPAPPAAAGAGRAEGRQPPPAQPAPSSGGERAVPRGQAPAPAAGSASMPSRRGGRGGV